MAKRSSMVLRDPVHGDIELTRDEARILDTPEFQRLRGIKQLGTAYLVFPGAMHSRFEHSIGTLHMTDRLLDAVNKNAEREPAECRAVRADERRLLRIAALLHDVTHIPFGHNIEDQTGLLPRHDIPERFERVLLGDGELARVLGQLGVREDVLSILSGRGREVPAFWRQVLSDTIDSDLMDYLRRDAYYTGLELRYDSRVAGYFRVDAKSERMYVDCEKQGMLREDIMSEIVRMLETRYHFSERVYYHHAKVSAGALLARMVELSMRSGVLSAEALLGYTDQSLIDALARIGESDPRIQRFSDRFGRRELPKRVVVLPAYLNQEVQSELLTRYFKPGQPEARFEWEAEMEQAARQALGRDDVDVIMYCPARSMQLKEARTLVRLPGTGDRILPLGDFAAELPRLRDLEASYPRLWKLYVFASVEDREERKLLQKLCLDALPDGCTNALGL